MRRPLTTVSIALIVLGTSAAFFQDQAIPIHAVSAPTATLSPGIGSISELRELPDGRVMINDTLNRRLLAYNAQLSSYTVIADTTAATGRRYPTSASSGPALLIPYLADSTLLLDPTTRVLIVIDPKGVLGKVMALPRPGHASAMSDWRRVGTDAKGALIYQGGILNQNQADPLERSEKDPVPVPNSTDASPPDAPLFRADFDTRMVDTLAKFKFIRVVNSRAIDDDKGKLISATEHVNPLGATVDDWTTTSSGEVAIVRGHDYHIDWYLPDGKLEASPKLPYDWHRLSDAEKQTLLDITHQQNDSLAAKGFISRLRICDGFFFHLSAIDAARGLIPANDAGPAGCETVPVTMHYVQVAEMQDYLPPVRRLAVTADRDNNVWILPTTSLAAVAGQGPVYDLVSRAKGLSERVRIPLSRQIAGFGRNGTVYFKWPDPASGVWLLEKRQVIRN